MDQKHGRWTDSGKGYHPETREWNDSQKRWQGEGPSVSDTWEAWRTSGLEAQARAEMQEEIDRLKIDNEARISRGHAAMVLVLACSFCLAVGFMAGWRLFG